MQIDVKSYQFDAHVSNENLSQLLSVILELIIINDIHLYEDTNHVC